jgi:putative ubiquitin-RnfH superfamily antitoxin RatB of RatAB toxin-antitoxin module
MKVAFRFPDRQAPQRVRIEDSSASVMGMLQEVIDQRQVDIDLADNQVFFNVEIPFEKIKARIEQAGFLIGSERLT